MLRYFTSQANHMLKIVHYDNDCGNPIEGGIGWRLFHCVRNAVVRVCQTFGPTGPMGERPLGNDDDLASQGKWPLGDRDPVYWVRDDQYNAMDGYVYVDVNRKDGMSEEWLSAIAQCVATHKPWAVCISNLSTGYIIVFCDRILVTGEVFVDCRSVEDVVLCARDLLLS
jgi:hypothetical protein